jgi:hypothetical protein
MRDGRLAVAALAFAGYVAIAWSVDNAYPFSHFDMYSGTMADSGSRIVVRDASGAVHEVTRFTAFACDRPIPTDRAACPGDHYMIPYKDRELLGWVLAHEGDPQGGEPVDLVRRVGRLAGGGPPPHEDCLIASCRARPR